MKICHIVTRFIRGGADENTLHSCNGSVERGHTVYLIVGKEASNEQLASLRPEVIIRRVPTLVRQIAPLRDLIALFWLIYLLVRIKPDVVHTHLSKSGIIGRIAAAMASVPIIVHGVHILPFVNVGRLASAVYRFVELVASWMTDAFVNVGEDMRDLCIRAGIGSADRHFVIPSGMDLEKFSAQRDLKRHWQRVLGCDVAMSDPKILLLVSRLEPRKGQYEFLEVFSRIAKRFPDCLLVLAGEGPEESRLRERVRALQLDRSVVFAGFRTDVHRLMAIADIGLLTSRREGLARVLVQYVSTQLPTVATDIPGTRNIVSHGVTGLLVPPDDPQAMESAIATLLADPDKLRTMKRQCAVVDVSRWSIDNMNNKLDDLYRQLAEEHELVEDHA